MTELGHNSFGDKQLDMDIQFDTLIYDCLKETGVVAYAMSEERPFVKQQFHNLIARRIRRN